MQRETYLKENVIFIYLFIMHMEISTHFEVVKFRVTHSQYISQPIITHLIASYASCPNSDEGNQSQVIST